MQNYKTNYWILLLITVLASGLTLLFLKNIYNQMFLIEQNSFLSLKETSKTDVYNVKVEKISETPFWYKSFDLDYPTGDLPGIELAQKFIKNEKDNFDCMNDSEKVSQEEAEKELGLVSTLSCSLSVSYSYIESRKFITHVFDTYYFAGGAHGIFSNQTIVVDKTGQEKKFSDFLKQEYKGTYPNKVVPVLKNHLVAELESNDFALMDFEMNYVFEENSIDDLPFFIKDNKFTFLFSESQGLSHAIGPVAVEVPSTDFAEVVDLNLLQ